MNVQPGLAMGTSGEEVTALHDALTVIGLQIEVAERDTRSFGASTVAAVIKLQALAGIEQTGVVDKHTTAVLSLTLKRLGIAPGAEGFLAAAAPYTISGTVTDAEGIPLANAKILAFDCELRSRKQIGESATDGQGSYRIHYKAQDLLAERAAADLQVEVRDTSGKSLMVSPITPNAPRQATIDLALGGPTHTTPSEFTSITNAVAPLLGKLTPAELEASAEHQDLGFISGQTGIAQPRLAYWATAARLAISTELPAELFYGLFRSGVPANAQVTVLASSTQGVNLQANAETLLEGVLLTSPAMIAAALEGALAANLIPLSYTADVPQDLERIKALASHATLTSSEGFGKTSFASVLGALSVESDVQRRFIDLYTAATGPAQQTFWSDLEKNDSFTETQVSALRFGVLAGRLTRGYLPLIEELAAQRNSNQIASARDLARLTSAEWGALLEKPQADGTPIGVPSFIVARTPALARETYAAMLERFFTRTYPTTAFTARVTRDAETPFASAQTTATFLDANPSFDLRFTNVDEFATKTAISPEIRSTLLTAQRLIKVNSDYTVMSALMADGVHTAQQIYAMGSDRFVARYAPLAALGATEAARTWARAEQTHAMALALLTKLNANLDASSPLAVGSKLPEDAHAKAAAFPNLQTLFGPESMCACEACQSVLGVAAYLTDILDFLGQREASGGKNVRDVLFERRADIAQIKLNCENTDTELPYIDLVNELLEEAVAPPQPPESTAQSAYRRQTTLSTPELNANPEYVNGAAYEKLVAAVYPWTLPFDLSLAETRTYLGQLNLSRAQLISTFQKPEGYPATAPAPQVEALALEQLGLSAMQADIITGGPLAAKFRSWDYWGLEERFAANSIVDPDDPTKVVAGTFWIEVLSQVRVLLARASLSLEELARLLNTIFVNGAGSVSIRAEPAGTCDVARMELVGLTGDVLDRIHRFERLRRSLGWRPYDLDNAIASLQSTTPTGLAQLNAQLLRQLACVSVAMQRYSLSVPSAVALFAPTPSAVTIATRVIPTLPGEDREYSLYHNLFENLTVLNPPDPAFALNAEGTELIAAASSTPAPELVGHGPTLVAALQISERELGGAIENFTDGKLTLANLSALYRRVQLGTALGITIEELVALLAIVEAPSANGTGHEPVEPFDARRPESLATFAELCATLAASGLSIEQADYLVRGIEDEQGLAPEPLAVGTLLLTLHNGLVKIATENTPAADPTGALTRKVLTMLLEPADLGVAMAILQGASALTAAQQEAFITSKLGPYIPAPAANEKLVGSTALDPGAPRFEYVLGQVLAHQTKQQSTELVVQTLAQALGLQASIAALVGEWLPSQNTPGGNSISDFVGLAGMTLASTTGPLSPGDTKLAPYFASYAALAKAALLITTLGLGVEDVRWWKQHGVAAGWLDPTTLPTAAGPAKTAEGRFDGLLRLIVACNVRRQIPIANATFATLFTAGTSKATYLAALATSTQWQQSTLEVLCGNAASDGDLGELSLVYPADYESEAALARILPCEAILTRVGIPAQLSSWTAATLSNETPSEIKQSVKANYPEAQWFTLAKQLRDPLRQLQRDALVSYLLADAAPTGVNRWLDPDDVFAHFLIDVEMCSCMATSRLVQATATVQLFVQRCFLGLEPNVKIDIGADSKWLQWQWMGGYRPWEANVKVFLHPEAYLDSSRRVSASPFFTELQQELKQSELTAETAETALQNYLEKLEVVARLDVCGTFHDFEKGQDVLHVLARTQGSPPIYYMRKWVGSSQWTAWEKVELDIDSEHVLPIVWNGRRYIFWAVVTVKADQHGQPIPVAEPSQTPPPSPKIHLEVRLAWSQYKQGKWQAKQTAPQTLVFSSPVPALHETGSPFVGFESADLTFRSSFNEQLLEIDVFLEEVTETRKRAIIHNSPRTHVGAFVLGGAGNGVEAFVLNSYLAALENVGGGVKIDQVGELHDSILKPSIAAPAGSGFDGDWFANLSMRFLSATRPRAGRMSTTYERYGTLASELVLNQADYYRLITPHQSPTFDSRLPFFYRDSAREYFVVPTNYYQNGNYFSIDAPADIYDPAFKVEYTFWPFYHPFVSLLVAQLNFGGLEAIYAQKLQLEPDSVARIAALDFEKYYEPTSYVLEPYPAEEIDFEADAGYALYNWEFFFHAPFLIANALSTNRQFEFAKQCYEYIFTPIGGSSESIPRCFWVTKPFYETTSQEYAEAQITTMMEAINHRDPELEHQVARWRADPFDPDMIAQMRPVAYQRAVVMRYLDNLIAWGDQLYTQNTRESINRATQLYVLAADLHGPPQELVAPLVETEVKTYSELQTSLDAFSNASVAAENAIPPVKVNLPSPPGSQDLPSLSTLYFRIPPNTQLQGYWDTITDRLFKIRHCMNIEGVVEQLPLFAPPIDPELLIDAAAAGLDLTSVLSETGAALPPYRFRTVIRNALELCDQVRSLGAELLAALEKRDAEELAQTRSTDELSLQKAIEEVRTQQVEAAKQAIDVVAKSKQSFVDREKFYVDRPFMKESEAAAMVLNVAAGISQVVATVLDGTGAVAHALPSVEAGATGFGGSPTVTVKIGGENVGHAANSGAWIARMIAGTLQTQAQLSATLGQYQQRQDEWNLQGTVAADEVARVEAEKVAAEIRLDVAEQEKAAQELSVKEAHDVETVLLQKFTNEQLYDWMVNQTSTTYFQAYQLAYSMAKTAERCFKRELAISDSGFVQFGYWDNLHRGLTAAEKLHYDLRRLESAYYTQHERELEIVKHVSLLQLDPYALVELRETGTCQIELTEMLFDLDNPGHYMRRLKSVGLTVPCVVGPYASVSATLALLNSKVRVSPTSSGSYASKPDGDERFREESGGEEIVTSSAQSDSGLFELRFEDERYLPFEGAGAISRWRLTLNNVYPQFDYSTITDVVLHLRYTARDGGAPLHTAASNAVKAGLNEFALAEEGRTGLYRLFSARHEFPTNWAQFLNPAAGSDQILTLQTPPERFPFFTNGLDLKVRSLDVFARTAGANPYTLLLSAPAGATQTLPLEPDTTLKGMHHREVALQHEVNLGRAPLPSGEAPPTWTVKLKQAGAANFRSLVAAEIEDVLMLVAYQVSA